MAETLEELLKIEEDIVNNISGLTDDELLAFNDFLSNLTVRCNMEIGLRWKHEEELRD